MRGIIEDFSNASCSDEGMEKVLCETVGVMFSPFLDSFQFQINANPVIQVVRYQGYGV